MANRYWVGGTDNWNSTAGTKWATTSGGVGGASVPTSSDDVFFDAASGAVTVTVTSTANCRDIDFTGFGGTFAGGVAMNVAGSFKLVSGMTYTFTGDIDFTATSTGKTITLGGKTTGSLFNFTGVGGGWTVQDAWNNGSQNIVHTRGTLNTNGQTITCGTFRSSNSNTRTLTLGASTINCLIWLTTNTAGLTFNANTSSIVLTGTTPEFSGGGLTFNNVTFTLSTNSVPFIDGANTFANLTITGAATKTGTFTFLANQIISGTFTLNGNSAINRIGILTDAIGTQRTLTVNTTVTVSNADFLDINGAGSASWNISGASGGSGDAGGNTGITFTTPATQTWSSNSGNWSDVAKWTSRVPLPQDDVVFNASSFSTGGQTVTADMPRSGKNIDWTGVTNTPAYNIGSASKSLFGSLKLVSGMTIDGGTQPISFFGRGSYTLESAGQSFNSNITMNAPGGTMTLVDDFNAGSSLTLTILRGTFDANDKNVTVGKFDSSNSNTRVINMGNGDWTLTSAGIAWDLSTVTGLTFNCESSRIIINNAASGGKTFHGGGLTYNNFLFTGAGTGALTISGSNTWNDFAAATQPKSILFTAGTTQTMQTWSVEGSAGNLMTINSTTTTNFNLSIASGVVNTNYLSIANSNAIGGATWYAGPNSTDAGGGNTGWIFTAAVLSTTKSLRYAIDVVTPVTKSLQYAVKSPVSPTKSLQYCLFTSSSVSKSLEYRVVLPNSTNVKTLQYCVLSPFSIPLGLQYGVKGGVSIQKSLQYGVSVPGAYEKTLQYALKKENSVALGLQYTVEIPSAPITKDLAYRVKTTPSAMTKALSYSMLISRPITKALTYVVNLRIYPYSKKASPYSKGATPYSKKTSPYVALRP